MAYPVARGNSSSSQNSLSDTEETFRIKTVGAPLQAGADYEFIFEITLEVAGAVRKYWTVQRGLSHFEEFHEQLQTAYPRLALPKLPHKSTFRGLLKPEKAAKDLSEKLVSYLQTLVAIPMLHRCPQITNLLEIPSAESLAARGTSDVLGMQVRTGGCRDTCARFCRRLMEILGGQPYVVEEFVVDGEDDRQRRQREILERSGAGYQPSRRSSGSFGDTGGSGPPSPQNQTPQRKKSVLGSFPVIEDNDSLAQTGTGRRPSSLYAGGQGLAGVDQVLGAGRQISGTTQANGGSPRRFQRSGSAQLSGSGSPSVQEQYNNPLGVRLIELPRDGQPQEWR